MLSMGLPFYIFTILIACLPFALIMTVIIICKKPKPELEFNALEGG
jgi:hypothetical protein